MAKLTHVELDNLAEQWSDAYSADRCGREVSIGVIAALFQMGFNIDDAREVYFSKHLRWFFDYHGDDVQPKQAKELFIAYLSKRGTLNHVRAMFVDEIGRELVLAH